MSKYDPLWKYIRQKNCDSLLLSFNLIYDILGFEIDHSFLTYIVVQINNHILNK